MSEDSNFLLRCYYCLDEANDYINVKLKKKVIKKRIKYVKEHGNIQKYEDRNTCNTDCDGWDGINSKCMCGNVNIGWSNDVSLMYWTY